MNRVRFDPDIAECIENGDAEGLKRLLQAAPEKLHWQTPFAGGTWLHYAAGLEHVSVLNALTDLGLDVNTPSMRDDARKAICDAAHAARSENALFLLDAGSDLDTDASVRNPLFAAIVGQAAEIVRLVIERGIDASVRYNSETMIDMDATAFALWRGETDIARIVALHQAGGSEGKAQALLDEARDVVSRNTPLETVRIVPTMEDIERE
jgi:uncharacterized protein